MMIVPIIDMILILTGIVACGMIASKTTTIRIFAITNLMLAALHFFLQAWYVGIVQVAFCIISGFILVLNQDNLDWHSPQFEKTSRIIAVKIISISAITLLPIFLLTKLLLDGQFERLDMEWQDTTLLSFFIEISNHHSLTLAATSLIVLAAVIYIKKLPNSFFPESEKTPK